MKLRWLALIVVLLLSVCTCIIIFGQEYLPPSTEITNPSEMTTYPTEPSDAPSLDQHCPQEDPYQNVDKTAFYDNYTPACCWTNAQFRSEHGLLSGDLNVPGQYVQEADDRPQIDGKYVRNTSASYADNGNTYIVVDSHGNEVLRIYEGGGYITLEEVAA